MATVSIVVENGDGKLTSKTLRKVSRVSQLADGTVEMSGRGVAGVLEVFRADPRKVVTIQAKGTVYIDFGVVE